MRFRINKDSEAWLWRARRPPDTIRQEVGQKSYKENFEEVSKKVAPLDSMLASPYATPLTLAWLLEPKRWIQSDLLSPQGQW